MVIALRKWGNSTAVRIPRKVVEELNWKVGEELDFSVTENGLVLKPSRKPTIENLFVGFEGHITEEEIDWGESQGLEVW